MACFALRPKVRRGGLRLLSFLVMKILPFVSVAAAPVVGGSSVKVTRLSCCCKLSELLPLVRQFHEEARATQALLARGGALQQAA